MKAELELDLDSNGRPCIRIKHHDRSSNLEQKILGVFIKAAKEKGCVLKNTGGYLEVGTSNSWESYEIQIKK